MYQKITREPMDEKELVESKEFVQGAPLRVEELTEVLKEVSRHYNLLEHFSYMYQELDIEKYWYMKIWPIKIQAQLTDAKSML
jgi:chromosome segregation and condensation protein ScpB